MRIRKKTDKTLAIVNSPLQVMMALEYIKEFDVKNVDFVVSVYSVDYLKYNRSVLRYLNDVGAKYKIYITKNILKSLRFINSPKVYNRFIVGDFRSLDKKLLTLFHAKGKIELVYVDDGNASFEFETGFTSNRGIGRIIDNLVERIVEKRTTNRVFYSAFINKDMIRGIRVIPNQMKTIGIENRTISSEIIVIGCFSEFFTSIGLNYQEYLSRLNVYILNKWGREIKVKYYPHRREDDINGIKLFCKDKNWEVCFSRINVELELVTATYAPQSIIGFGSSALFLLKKLFKNSEVETIHFTESSEYLKIEKEYSEIGIGVISI